MRRRTRDPDRMPECLRRFAWEEWRPPAPAGHPDPSYVEWYLALGDWLAAKDAWLAGERPLLPPERPLPDPIPYTGLLPAIKPAEKRASSDVPRDRIVGRVIRNH